MTMMMMAEEQVEKLVKYLDPNDLGRINFKDFCRGVFAMKGCEELLKDVLSMESAGTLPCAPEIPDCVEQKCPLRRVVWDNRALARDVHPP
ncbi:hypothetical protein CB1_000765056 [Camelus ferus]|nr:hypothetical protein CB1_000765056 [Camelus ferus]